MRRTRKKNQENARNTIAIQLGKTQICGTSYRTKLFYEEYYARENDRELARWKTRCNENNQLLWKLRRYEKDIRDPYFMFK